MATKSKMAVKPAAEKFPRQSVHIYAGKTEQDGRENFAALLTSPELAAYRVINGAENKTAIGEGIDIPALMADLRAQGRAVNAGEMRQVEAMLINQATALKPCLLDWQSAA